ncbi:FAD-binding domain-containing protein [Tropicibacter sp. S64]|uniref:FAD-binding domain-containing protein n=1 Tax=Tropicibacter sp. S64 TaxID=3415122 RepID=UPI003C7E7DFC
MRVLNDFPPTRLAGLARLADFAPRAGRAYAARRNFDPGPDGRAAVSGLSPYLRHRVVTEEECLKAILARHSPTEAQKFLQEVLWRTYWKGWLEMRPGVWPQYQAALRQRLDEVQTQSGLRDRWEAACKGETGITCFDAWARELVTRGYLHNHARMWFASIWIFTLRLPWELGADFFLRHLVDGDVASNTLSWRWVAGIQTPGKTYLATAENIAQFTEGRFSPAPGELADHAEPIPAPPLPERIAPPEQHRFDTTRRTALILHTDDLSPGWLLMNSGLSPVGTATLCGHPGLTPLQVSPNVIAWKRAAIENACGRSFGSFGEVTHGLGTAQALEDWAKDLGAEQIVTPYAPVGPVADVLKQINGLPVIQPLRPLDLQAWPHATAGFFKFNGQIPGLLDQLLPKRAA